MSEFRKWWQFWAKAEDRMPQPPLGWTTDCKLVRVIDGDTIVVTIERELTVRMLSSKGRYNTPEMSTGELGAKYKQILIRFLESAPMDSLVLYIPASEDDQIKDVFTFGRVLGHVFSDSVNVGDIIYEIMENEDVPKIEEV